MKPWLRLSTVLLLLSAGLHGVVLSLPLPDPEAEPEVPAEAAAEATETIDVVSLPSRGAGQPAPDPAAATKPPSPQPAPKSSPPRTPPAPVAQSVPAPAPNPSPSPIPERSPADEPEPQFQPEPALEPEPARPLEDPEAYVYNQKSSGSYNGSNEFLDWTVRLLEQGLQPEKLTTPVITVAYPLSNCLRPEPVQGSLGVIVTPGGQISGQETLGTTGYDVLDEQALEMLNTADLPAVEQARAFSLSVVVQYDPANCMP